MKFTKMRCIETGSKIKIEPEYHDGYSVGHSTADRVEQAATRLIRRIPEYRTGGYYASFLFDEFSDQTEFRVEVCRACGNMCEHTRDKYTMVLS